MHFSNKKLIFVLTLSSFLALGPDAYASKTDDSWILNRQGMYKISQGNVEGAIDDFEKACRLDPFNDTALANLACARNNLGVNFAKKQNFAEAIRQFKNAKDQKPEDISIRLNLLSTLVTVKNTNDTETEIKELLKLRPNDSDIAIKAATAYQKIENTIAAISTLQEFTERNPGDAKVNATLAKLLYLNGNLAESKYYITRSLEISPDDKKNQEFLAKLDKETCVEATTNSYSGKHFELACPDSFSEDWAEDLLEQLENAYEEVGNKLNFYPEQKAQVVLLQTDDFKMVHDLPDWAGGVYDGKIKLPVPTNIQPRALKGAILHEYAHHVIYLASSGNCPIWLNEGLAQVFEKNSEELPEIPENQNEGSINLHEINSGFRQHPNRAEAAKLYRLSFNSTCKFIEEYSWNHVAEILQLLALGKTFNEATNEILGESQSEVESRIACSN